MSIARKTLAIYAASAALAFAQSITPSSINKIQYVNASWNWSQVDAAGSIGNLSVAGINTLTFTPCPPGINGSDTNLYIYISGVGTAEPAQVTTSGGAGTCTPRAATGTVKVTTVNTHGAGFTIGSASTGIYEALRDAQAANNNNIHLILQPTNPPGTVYFAVYAPITNLGSNVDIDGASATIDCEAKQSCFLFKVNSSGHFHGFRVASKVSYAGVAITNTVTAANVTTITSTLNPDVGSTVDIQQTFNKHYWGPHVVTTTSAGSWTYADTITTIASQVTQGGNAYQNALIEDNGQGVQVDHLIVDPPGGFTGNLNNIIVVLNDQAFHVSDVNVGNIGPCTVNYCPNFLYAPGPFSANASVIYADHFGLSLACKGNGFTMFSGNTAHISDAVIQGYNQWAVYTGTLNGGFGPTTETNVYNEVGACVNPQYPGSGGQQQAEAGTFAAGGDITIRGGEAPIGQLPKFASTGNGGTQYNYAVVVKDSVLGTSTPLLFGYATVDSVTPGAGSIVASWPRVPGTNTVTYDVLRYTGSGNSVISPYNGGCAGGTTTACGSIATAQAQCATTLCSFTDTANTVTANYAVTTPNYYPFLPFWPGGLVMSVNGDTQTDHMPPMAYLESLAFVTNISPITSVGGWIVPSIHAARCDAGVPGTWIVCLDFNSNGNNTTQIGGTLLQNGPASGGSATGRKGRLNFIASPGASIGQTHIITLVDSLPGKTLNTSTFRPTNDATDTFIAQDRAGVSVGQAGLGFGSPIQISNYIANVGDDTLWKERLTATLKSWKVPVTAIPSDNTKVAGTFQCGLSAGASQVCMQVNDQGSGAVFQVLNNGSVNLGSGTTKSIFTNTAANSDLAGSLTLSAGTQTYNFTGTYATAPICVGTDITAANAIQVQTTTTVLTLTGTGTDVINYVCMGLN